MRSLAGVAITIGLASAACGGGPSSQASVPVLTTTAVSGVTHASATAGGRISSDGGAEVTSRGVCWSAGSTPTIADSRTTDGAGAGSFVSSVTGLSPNTTYYVRAYAANSTGTGYGGAVAFTTSATSEGTVTDVDGNVYRTVTIGNQVWMAENLRATRYNDGRQIPFVTDQAAWSNLRGPGYTWYDNDPANRVTYGGLYNWYAVNTGRLAPVGWHVPTHADWTALIGYLGGESVAGGRLKEPGTMRWASPNAGATNESGFTALPAGVRSGEFMLLGSETYIWSATQDGGNTELAYQLHLRSNSAAASFYTMGKGDGFSVRCIRN